jgi:hypothetical protein
VRWFLAPFPEREESEDEVKQGAILTAILAVGIFYLEWES